MEKNTSSRENNTNRTQYSVGMKSKKGPAVLSDKLPEHNVTDKKVLNQLLTTLFQWLLLLSLLYVNFFQIESPLGTGNDF